MRGTRPAVYVLLSIIVAAYWIVGSYPLKLDLPSFQENGLRHGVEGSFDFVSPGIAHTTSAPDWIDSVIQKESLAVSVTACSYHTPQVGPARIVTISKDLRHRNFTIAQEGSDLVVRLRRYESDLSGLPPYIVQDVFMDSTCREIQVAIESLKVKINVDGAEELAAPLEPGSFGTWDRGFRLAIGNELTNDRPWLGSVKAVFVGLTSTSTNYFDASSLVFPKRLWHLPPRLQPLVEGNVWTTNRSDAALNVIGFMPLPFLLAVAGMPAGRKCAVLTFAIVLSLSIELGQLFFAYRYPSIADLCFNTVGAALGILFLNVVTRHKVRAPRRMER